VTATKEAVVLLRCILISGAAWSQESIEAHLVKINIVTPGFTYEKGITENSSANFDALLGFVFQSSKWNNSQTDESFFIMYPGLGATLQYYFNRYKREQRGRSLYKNSGMFIGPQIVIQGPDIVNTNPDYVDLLAAIGVGGVWGIQRTFKSNINIALHLGLGYAAPLGGTEAPGGFTSLSKLLLGYVIVPNGKKKKQYELPQDYRY